MLVAGLHFKGKRGVGEKWETETRLLEVIEDFKERRQNYWESRIREVFQAEMCYRACT